MKILLTLFVLLFSSSVVSEDISDFEIEGMSIGDSLLEHMSEDEIISGIEESKKLYTHKSKNFSEIYLFNETDNYNYLSFIINSFQ